MSDETPDLQAQFKELSEKIRNDDPAYLHTNADRIKLEAMAELQKTAQGGHLIGIAQENGIATKIIKGNDLRGYLLDDTLAVVSVPAAQTMAKPRDILNMAGALRDAEQSLLGYKRIPEGGDRIEFEAKHHDKNLDIMVKLCILVREFEELGQSEYIQEFERMGWGFLLRLHKKGVPYEELKEAYVQKVFKDND